MILRFQDTLNLHVTFSKICKKRTPDITSSSLDRLPNFASNTPRRGQDVRVRNYDNDARARRDAAVQG